MIDEILAYNRKFVAEKAYEKYEQRIADLKGFIELAEAELKKQESGGNA